MNWYKISQENKQIPDFPTYLTQQITQLSQNYSKSIPYRIKKMLDYITFMESSIIKYNIPYQQMPLEELFRTCTYIMEIEKNPENIKHLPKEIQNNPHIQAALKAHQKPA